MENIQSMIALDLLVSKALYCSRRNKRSKVHWAVLGKLLKAVFPLALDKPEATYDMGLGAVERAVADGHEDARLARTVGPESTSEGSVAMVTTRSWSSGVAS